MRYRRLSADMADMATRRKTTVYLDEDLIRWAKVLATRTDRKDYEILEAALRQYLGVDVLERVWARSDLTEEEALKVAYEELNAMRRERAASTG
jgi:predicted transcriptional regulator